jgi:hypothetical protein
VALWVETMGLEPTTPCLQTGKDGFSRTPVD